MTNVASDKAQVSELTRELTELRGRHEAVADILRALSTSGMRLQPSTEALIITLILVVVIAEKLTFRQTLLLPLIAPPVTFTHELPFQY